MGEQKTYGWGWTLLWFVCGLVGPAVCLGFELLFRMCRDLLFDPLPTVWHGLLVGLVPLASYAGMKALAQPEWRTRTVGVLLGSAICTTVMYAVPFVPLLPIALVLTFSLIGLFGLAPVLAPLATITLAVKARKLGVRGFAIGFFGCVALLALIDFGSVRTILGVRRVAELPEDGSRADWLLEHADRGMLAELAGGRPSARPLALLVRRFGAPVDPEFVRVNWRRFTGDPLPEALRPEARD